jgi:hypothetical protein
VSLAQRLKHISLAVWREDRDGQLCRRRQRQLVQVVPLIERAYRRSRLPVEVELRSQQPLLVYQVKFRPAAAARRDDLLEARRGAREVV